MKLLLVVAAAASVAASVAHAAPIGVGTSAGGIVTTGVADNAEPDRKTF